MQRAILARTKKAIKARSDDVASDVFEALEADGVVSLDTLSETEIERLNKDVGRFIFKTIRSLRAAKVA
jgi:hypothetical protein